ncbi:Rossmann-like and DUF2520 domain-containing protein [Ottowia thiooxydans]|uniref:Rossmann-like and DUF2520 domain-containing protein n=1 Tax=Ottowia thiooxydans TaxID=219182 RepID=UPI00041ECFCE|nr:DUF2520 domain-containing protein [Ottowia thiooxydans]
MKIAFVGAGRLAQTLAAAFHRTEIEVVAVFNRSRPAAESLATMAGACKVCETPQQAADMADLVFITVSDDAIGTVVRQVNWRQDQCVVHCSGASEVSVLEPAAVQGAAVGGFHPLQIFSDPTIALPRVAGSSVAIEAEGSLELELNRLAAAVGYRVIKLPPGARGRYHAATNYAASFMLSLLREACDLWNSFGVSDQEALAALLPLTRGTLDAATAKGLAGAMAGPISRGDASVVALHLRELAELGEDTVDFYRSVSMRQLRLARDKGHLDNAVLERLDKTLRES